MRKLLFASAMALVVSGGWAHANTVNGSLWHVPEAKASNAILANLPVTTPDVTFSVDSPLTFSALNASVGTWLGSGSAFNITENTANTLTSLMDNSTTGTLVYFAGLVSVTNGQSFDVVHDDGLTLKIGSTNVISVPGNTPPVLTSVIYGGPTGNFPFELLYGECCKGNSVLQVDLPFTATSATPLPAALPLFASGLGTIGLFGWRRKRKKAAAKAAA